MTGRARMVRADGLEFGLLEAGTGPLALCLHGFPDSAHTWRHLLPGLAEAGFHAVAPFLRGYAPTAVPDDGRNGIGALVADAERLLPPGSRMTVVQGAGHFLHLKQPSEVNRHILSWVTG
jgi:pimeloyl-ACP methyl ester carboxylesterase